MRGRRRGFEVISPPLPPLSSSFTAVLVGEVGGKGGCEFTCWLFWPVTAWFVAAKI